MASKAVNALTAILVLLLAVAGIVYLRTGPCVGTPSDYDRTNVTLEDRNGSALATVAVRVADTNTKRCVGLSNTESLADGEGMLFVHENADTHAYVMRDMAFPLDIVFVAGNGTVTEVHHAATEPGESGDDLTRYRGTGKYVLEVPRGYANATGLDVGDRVVVPSSVTED
ncbi:DUF192 domain-containing protein [Halorientalis marina]|jgi:uncharacterized membrane protein (UPF0127 family)|uniref:DUF192 domain-containing protein n=1 Tax=Halorientalis marina TaxID=2931976 RepID=UPI001FF50E1E|nr:DUF192 domain-containing protein [Halorientalis marina]